MKKLLLGLMVSFCFLSTCTYSVEAENIKQTEVSKYALSWADNKNIPYVYGGAGRNMDSLEEVAEKKAGLDCSGFTMLVYRHFGIDIPSTSKTQKNKAKKTFTSLDKAVPGDICWWDGHVAIYIGEGKIVHTNTHEPPTNYPHVSIVEGEGKNYTTPELILRMVDNVEDLKPLSGSDASDLNDEVKNAEGKGSLTTESDLTGMPTDWSLGEEGENITLPGEDSLTNVEKDRLASIKESINDRHDGFFDVARVIVSGIGLAVIIYGVLLVVAYLFDRVNTIIEISLLSIITLGRYRVWYEDLGVKVGYNKSDGKMYCDRGTIIKMFFITEVIGFFLIGDYIFRMIYNFILWITQFM